MAHILQKGRVSGLMCSYNAVNGVPSCANDWLLNEVAREEWGFDGYGKMRFHCRLLVGSSVCAWLIPGCTTANHLV